MHSTLLEDGEPHLSLLYMACQVWESGSHNHWSGGITLCMSWTCIILLMIRKKWRCIHIISQTFIGGVERRR